MITLEQKQLILEFTTDWVAQFPDTTLISIKYSKDKKKLGQDFSKDDYTCIKIDINTPDVSRGRIMHTEIITIDDDALDGVLTALYELTDMYNNVEIHKSVGFYPMPKEKSDKWSNNTYSKFKGKV